MTREFLALSSKAMRVESNTLCNLLIQKIFFLKNSSGLGKKIFGSDADSKIEPWSWFPDTKPVFGCRLGYRYM